ncbi:hypothetical protein [Zavarzinia sp. CC-PAN008]|uniref:hypothetical protein n=1 Tax=Zavarzinia sp. CC-PAN008 TaxID=3243332 RepID=UPI003F749797
MKMLSVLAGLAIGVAGILPAQAATDPDTFSLHAYDQQLQLVRKARMVCEATSFGLGDYQGCLMSKVEYYVRESGDPQLQQLNSLLPVRYRYDPNRTSPRPLGLLDQPFPPVAAPAAP